MPDGVFASENLGGTGRRPVERAIAAADRTLVAAGVLTGRRSDFGSTAPDMILSWGPGWEAPLQRRAPAARVVNCGSPRSDAFARLPPRPGEGRVLLCSQPLFLGQHVAPPRARDGRLVRLGHDDVAGGRSSPPGAPPPGGAGPGLSAAHWPPAPARRARAAADRGPRLGGRRPGPVLIDPRRGGGRVPDPDQRRLDRRLGRLRRERLPRGPSRPERRLPRVPRPGRHPRGRRRGRPRVDALRDDYLANIGDAARRNADALAALAVASPPGAARRV